ncbi:MAG: bifunctional riboflavin kinase/FAD synthetase [Nonomuraea sp.]|nr:bifunctional riboflavin kinase/FAD synthetase [Nonomuraea sp.]NUP65173.1 bifunctional riboflavin kinase/FAD synthetase [Nonomuraea sp.]NUP78468.1 bifunctional riboflavin kinase/FAD synthetase [Nonomuraea sp.]NUS03589.1 bifunctional riboflavin kinase/FAD synthetase [Nonomuraea sp.]NUT09952.1 bifunctional riboflavin kinase/FAD synthetase [Nonomuraea sp.]
MGPSVRGSGRSVVTIGVYDGVHRGHRQVVERAVAVARERGTRSVAVTFEPHPDEVVLPGTRRQRLTTLKRRAELLAELGVDEVDVMEFTLDVSRMSPDDFAQVVLGERLRAAVVVVGEDFTFGHRAAGDIEILRALGEKYDFGVEAVPMVGGVSSTAIRELIVAGDIEGANAALGRPHRVEGVVVRGYQRGRQLGFPTANVETPPHTAIPADGVYAGWMECVPVANLPAPYVGERWPAAISVGTNPTFEGVPRTVEAYALDRDDLELYGVHVAVEFAARLRGNTRFESIEALIDQIHADVDATRRLTG